MSGFIDTCGDGFSLESRMFAGYASVFNTADNGDDIVMPGAFTKSLKTLKHLPFLDNHNPNTPLGRIIVAEQDDYGLYVVGLKNKTARSLRIGEGLSFGYRVKGRKNSTLASGRKLTELEIVEVSVTPTPMHQYARIDLAGLASAFLRMGLLP